MSSTETLDVVERFTPEWLDQALRGSGKLGDARVVGVGVETVSGGLMTRMLRLRLEYDGDAGVAPRSVLVKTPTSDPGSLGVAKAMGLYAHEVGFYRDVTPLLPDLRCPRCFAAEHDSDTGDFVLVLEDLADARPGDVLTMCTPDECSAVIKQLVNFQAPLWNSPTLSAFPWMPGDDETQGLFDHFAAGLDGFVERFGAHLRPEHVELFEQVQPKAGAWARSWQDPTVLQHGDFRTDNMLFGQGDGAAPLTVIDFQTLRLGPPGVDLAYFLGASLDVATRREVERDLVDEHRRLLTAAGVADWNSETAWASYREGALYGVFLFVGTAAQVVSNERADRVIVDQIGRYADMAIDLDAISAAGL